MLIRSVSSAASVASGTELPQMVIEMLVLRHTPFRARHASEEGVDVAVAPPFSLRLELAHDAEQAVLHCGEVRLVLDHKTRPVGAFLPNGFSPRKLLRIVQLKSLPGQICF